jgi:hypothetical protein
LKTYMPSAIDAVSGVGGLASEFRRMEEAQKDEHARQAIPYTDFPLDEIRLYACWDTEHWVIMLPSKS